MSTRWIIDFEALDPKSPMGGTWLVGVFEWRLKLLQSRGHDAKRAQLRLVQETLEDGGTERIYGGWSRPDMDNCFVYVGRPTHNWTSLTIETPAPPNRLFLVFVSPDGTISDWGWRDRSDDDPLRPADVKGTLIWPEEQS